MLYFREQDGAWCFLSQKQLYRVHRKGGKRGPSVLVAPGVPETPLSSVPQGWQDGESEPVHSVFPSSWINGSLSPFCIWGCCLSVSKTEIPALLCRGWTGKFLSSLAFPLSLHSQDLTVLENMPSSFSMTFKIAHPWILQQRTVKSRACRAS